MTKQTRLRRMTDDGEDLWIGRVEGKVVAVEARPAGKRARVTRKTFASAKEAQSELRQQLDRKVEQGYVYFGDGATAAAGAMVLRAVVPNRSTSTCFDLHPDGHTLAFGTTKKEARGAEIHRLDLRSGKLERLHAETINPQAPRQTFVHAVLYHPSGDALVYALNEETRKLDLASGQSETLARYREHSDSHFNPHCLRPEWNDARTHLLCFAARDRVQVRDVGGELVFEQAMKSTTAECRAAALSRQGRYLALYVASRAIVYGHKDAKKDTTNEVRIYDVQGGHEVTRLPFDAPLDRIGFGVNEEELVLTHQYASGPSIYDLRSGERRHRFEDPHEPGRARTCTGWAFSPDGRWLALGSRAGAAVFDAVTKQPATFGPLETRSVSRLVFSRDGRLLVTGGDDGNLVIHKLTAEAVAIGPPVATEAPAAPVRAAAHKAGTGKAGADKASSEALLRDWDAMNANAEFPCGRGYLTNCVSLWDARLECFTHGDRYWVVFQLWGWSYGGGTAENFVVAGGDEQDWPRQVTATCAAMTTPQLCREYDDYTRDDAANLAAEERDGNDPKDPAGDWARLGAFRVTLDGTDHALRPTLDDYGRAGIGVTRKQYAANYTVSHSHLLRVSGFLLRDKIWHPDPLSLLKLAKPRDAWIRVLVEQGTEVLEHLSTEVSPSQSARWRAVAARLSGDTSAVSQRVVDPVEAEVRRTLALPEDDVRDLTPAELDRITALELNDRPTLRDITFVARLRKLRRLWLFRTRVSDLSPLSGLTALEELNLHETAVEDIGPLSGCPKLRSLTLSHTRVSNVAPLAGLRHLQTLDLTSTDVTDVAPVRSTRVRIDR